jgi:transposase
MKKNSKQQTQQQPSKSQQTKQQQRKSQQTNQQRAASEQQAAERPPAGQPRTPFVEQLETKRKQMQESNEIGGVAGVDIGDKRSYVRLVGLDGELLEEIKIPTRPAAIEKYFRSWPRLRVVLETGGHTNWIRRLIAELGHEVFVADARQLQLISQSYAKNDRNDAYWLAELGRTNTDLLAPVEPRGQQVEQHRSWLQGRETLVGARTKLINSLRGIAKSHGIRFGPCGMTKWAAAVEEQCPAVLQTILKPMARIIAALTQEINELDRRLEKLGKEQYRVTQLLRTVDGVGPLTSLAFVLELNNDVGRVKRSRQMGAVVGCRPKQRDSGESSPELGITKAGNPMLRRLLVQCSQRILGPFGVDSDLRRWGLQLAARGKKRAKRRAVVAAARKLAVLLHAMWRKNEAWKPFPNGEPAAVPAIAASAAAGQ